MTLSAEQRKRVEESQWVVNTVLKKQGLSSNEDFRQSALLYMCKCVLRFDETRGTKWETYAYSNVYLYVKKLSQRARRAEIRRVDIAVEDLDIAVDCEPYNANGAVVMLEEIRGVCSEEENKVLDLRLKGFTGKEIADALGCCSTKINNIFSVIKEKAKAIMV